MVGRLREDVGGLEVAVTAVAEATGIPAAHVEKLMLLHTAATGEVERRLAVARHYYDVWCLLQEHRIVGELAEPRVVATMARDVETFTRAAGLPSRGRPAEGFGASEAFDPSAPVNEPTRGAYDTVVLGSLLWEGSPRPSFEECCDAVRAFPSGL